MLLLNCLLAQVSCKRWWACRLRCWRLGNNCLCRSLAISSLPFQGSLQVWLLFCRGLLACSCVLLLICLLARLSCKRWVCRQRCRRLGNNYVCRSLGICFDQRLRFRGSHPLSRRPLGELHEIIHRLSM
jgi:hypothetical protein